MTVAIVTGSGGLVGSECVDALQYYDKVVGIENNMRGRLFGDEAATHKTQARLARQYSNFIPYHIDIRDKNAINNLFTAYGSDIDIVIHTAAQPSHDWAAKEPFTDFHINATGTLNLLEAYRLHAPKASFIFTSTNKVYGDRPNLLDIVELDTRYHYPEPINEHMSIDHCKHSLFGASKVAADVMVQEYGRYFGLNTVSFRCGCLTGGNHKGTKLHGFLSYLVKCIMYNLPYTIYGYKGKQVRDNIHSKDLVNAFLEYHKNPTKNGAVYNMGGGEKNSISILEAIEKINALLSTKWNNYKISPEPRIGDHKWYVSDLWKFESDFPKWKINHNLDMIIQDIAEGVKND